MNAIRSRDWIGASCQLWLGSIREYFMSKRIVPCLSFSRSCKERAEQWRVWRDVELWKLSNRSSRLTLTTPQGPCAKYIWHLFSSSLRDFNLIHGCPTRLFCSSEIKSNSFNKFRNGATQPSCYTRRPVLRRPTHLSHINLEEGSEFDIRREEHSGRAADRTGHMDKLYAEDAATGQAH